MRGGRYLVERLPARALALDDPRRCIRDSLGVALALGGALREHSGRDRALHEHEWRGIGEPVGERGAVLTAAKGGIDDGSAVVGDLARRAAPKLGISRAAEFLAVRLRSARYVGPVPARALRSASEPSFGRRAARAMAPARWDLPLAGPPHTTIASGNRARHENRPATASISRAWALARPRSGLLAGICLARTSITFALTRARWTAKKARSGSSPQSPPAAR
jgi:hypothetical protein